MTPEILIAVLAFSGTMVGSISGIVISAKLTNYRIAQLEKKVDKHNNFAEKIPMLEAEDKRQCERIKVIERKIGIA